MAKIVTMGEMLLRLSTPSNNRFVQCESFDVVYGGSEANVALSLACFGHDAYFVTKLPKHEVGQSAVNVLRRYGVHTDYIARGGERIGIYFLETGAALRSSQVIYDRKDSAIALAEESDFDFDAIMKDASYFHISGITPAISDKAATLTKAACIAAKKHGVKITFDLNYRSKLWSIEKAQSVLIPLMEYVDVCIANPEAVECCLGVKDEHFEDILDYENVLKQLCDQHNFEYIVYTFRDGANASVNGVKAMIYNGEEVYVSKRHEINPILDRIGGGDAFTAGLIYGLLDKPDYKEAIEFAIAADAYKHCINGDFNIASVEEINALAYGNAIGRVKR